jgi:hypothetical protein
LGSIIGGIRSVKVPIPQKRATVVEGTDGSFQVIIPPRRQIFAMIFLPIWLCGWLFGEVSVIRQLIGSPASSGPTLFMLVWLAGWTVGGGFALFLLLWMLAGRERAILRPDALVLQHEMLGVSRGREYDLGSVQNLRVSPDSYNPWDGRSAWRFWGLGGGVIAFGYGAKSFRFGGSLDEPEARDLIAQMRARHRFTESPDVA